MDKFQKFSLTARPASKVKAPLIAECLANIECKVEAIRLADQYSLIILEGVKAWYDARRKEKRTLHAHGDGTFSADGKELDLRKKMTKWKLP